MKTLIVPLRLLLLASFFAAAIPATLKAQTDEIQVYDAEIADKGVFNIMLHTNFIAKGHTEPAFPGGLIPNH